MEYIEFNENAAYIERTDEGNIRLMRVWGTVPVFAIPAEIGGCAVTEIGSYCFARERRIAPLSGVSTSESERLRGMAELCGSYIEEITLPDTIIKVGNLAFYNCTALRELSIGKAMDAVGSDAFMNCVKLHRIIVRGRAKEPCGVRQVLAQISSDMEVIYETNGETDAAIFFPDYYESLDEIAPAHLFGRNIEGEGFRARQCFKDGVLDFAQYDMIFKKACAEENERTLVRMVSARLMYPVGMTDAARLQYEDFAKKHCMAICRYALNNKDLEMIRLMVVHRYADSMALFDCIRTASEMEWSEGAAALLRMKHEFFETSTASRYSFED